MLLKIGKKNNNNKERFRWSVKKKLHKNMKLSKKK